MKVKPAPLLEAQSAACLIQLVWVPRASGLVGSFWFYSLSHLIPAICLPSSSVTKLRLMQSSTLLFSAEKGFPPEPMESPYFLYLNALKGETSLSWLSTKL